MKPFVVYLLLHVPFAPDGYKDMIYRLPATSYETAGDCQDDAPRQVAAWVEAREKVGQGSIEVRRIICLDTRPEDSQPA